MNEPIRMMTAEEKTAFRFGVMDFKDGLQASPSRHAIYTHDAIMAYENGYQSFIGCADYEDR